MMLNEGPPPPESFGDKDLELKVKFHSLEHSQNGNFAEHFTNYGEHGVAKSEPGGFIQTEEFVKNAEKIFHFKPKSDDVWIVTFPKCGTTWTQELVWLLVNNCDTELAKKQPQVFRSPFLELPYMIPSKFTPPEFQKMTIPLEVIERMPSPRAIKSHLPFYLLPPKLLDTSKVVYVARNPKDVIVSYFYHHKLIKFHDYTGDIEKFAQYFMDDELLFSPFFPHILDAWSKRNHPNLLFLFYEDLKKDLVKEIKKVAAFLNTPVTEEQIALLKEHLLFDNFAKNESVNYEMPKKLGALNNDGHFIRKGKIGDWKNHFSPDLNKRLDSWIEKNLEGSDLKFFSEPELQD